MKILQIFGWVVGAHLVAFIFIFASPGCQAGPRTMPTPDATMPAGSAQAPVTFNTSAPQPVDLGTSSGSYTPAPAYGHAAPTRPGSAAAVAVTPAKAPEPVAPVSTYTVERGDSLWSIAKKNGLSVAELAKANSISTGTALRPGRKLIVPGKPRDLAAVPTASMSLPAEKTAMPNRPANGEGMKYTVLVGESLGVIAKKFQITVGELAAANNITDPSKVRAGQQLVIPGYKPVAGKGVTTATKPAASTPATSTPPASTPASTTAPEPSAPKFEIAPPPPGQDLDAGLKSTDTEVPTIKVEEPAPEAK
jgi:LysM repeat protein